MATAPSLPVSHAGIPEVTDIRKSYRGHPIERNPGNFGRTFLTVGRPNITRKNRQTVQAAFNSAEPSEVDLATFEKSSIPRQPPSIV
jgi:hypothetical protein